MADESAEIKKLIRLRNQRPSFSRMISWEMSQAAEQEPVKRAKQKKKKTSTTGVKENQDMSIESGNKDMEDIDDKEVGESSDSSEYETACEDDDFVEKTEELDIAESDSQFESIGTDILELDEEDGIGDCSDSDDEDDDLFMSSMSSNRSSIPASDGSQLGRRRRLSKKQKRKRKTYFRMTYLDDLYNLGNLYDATNDINDLFTEVLASETTVDVKRRVPTLVELCLKVNRRKNRSNSERQRNVSGTNKDKHLDIARPVIPHGMKRILSSWGRDQKQLENQLSFFLNKVLPLVEEKVTSKNYLCNDQRTGDFKKIVFQKRSVWSVLPFPPSKDILENVQYASEKSPAFLFVPSLHIKEGASNSLYYTYLDHLCYDNVALTNSMWALATTIDLMLPSQVNTTSIIRVKRALNLRYKCLVETMFECVLPYVMWARGKVAMATDMFRNLVEKVTEVDTKAMYLSEIGRMHAMFGDSGTAEQFYKLATETAFEDLHGERRDRCINEVTEQKQILLASIYDSGVMDRNKCIQSGQCWGGVRSIPTVRQSTIIAGFDAFLCYHISNCSDTNLYDEALSRLEKMTKSFNYLYYYQSLLHALQGSGDRSKQLYRDCRSCCFHTPGENILSLLGRRARNPWQPLVDIANAQKSEVKPLKVIWRTNLQAPRITNDRPMEAHINSRKLNLHQNEAGHITGDMQMTLPPLRDISLDQHTGALVLDNIPSHTGTWMSAFMEAEFSHVHDLLVPTPVLIYSGEDGSTVHMVKPSNSSAGLQSTPHYEYNGPPCPLMLYWTGPDGQMAKLNLFTLFKNQLKKDLVNVIKKNHDVYVDKWKYEESDYELMFKYIDLAYARNCQLTEQNITSAVSNNKSRRKKAAKKKEKVEKTAKNPTKKPMFADFSYSKNSTYETCTLDGEPFVFGQSIAISIQSKSAQKSLFIINTEDKSSFLSYELLENIGPSVTSCLIQQSRNNYTTEEYYMLLRQKEIVVLNQKGEAIQSIEDGDIIAVAKATDTPVTPVIIYPHIYGTSRERNGIWRAVLGLDPVLYDVEDLYCWTIGSVYDELAGGPSKEISISNITHIGEKTDSTGKLLMLNLVMGLGFIDPSTMDFVPIKVKEGCPKHFEFTSGDKLMKGDFENVKILAEKTFTEDCKAVCRTAFGVQNKVFLLDLSRPQGGESVELEMICSLELPGLPKEMCFVGKQIGMLISLTQHTNVEEDYYREHVFYFNFDGYLHGVLLCLNRGPRSFLPVYLHGNKGADDHQGEGTVSAGWHVYMRDGRDGILCVQLHS